MCVCVWLYACIGMRKCTCIIQVQCTSNLTYDLSSYVQTKADSGSEDEAESKRLNSAAKLNLQATAFQAMGLAWPESADTQGILNFVTTLLDLLTHCSQCTCVRVQLNCMVELFNLSPLPCL